MRIVIETIPHAEQRYNTLGDYLETGAYGDTLSIRVSECGDWRYEMLIALHELIEALICRDHQVSNADIDAFDLHYAGSEDEPGDDRDAPYYEAHQVASGFERLFAAALGVHWPTYDLVTESVTRGYPDAKGHEGGPDLSGAEAQGDEQGEGRADQPSADRTCARNW